MRDPDRFDSAIAMAASSNRIALHCHPDAPMPSVHGIGVRACIAADGALELAFRLDADLSALRIPPRVAAPGPTDGLWRHTCFEVFVAAGTGPGYHEFNLSPSGNWAAYAFDDYRVRAARAVPTVPALRLTRGGDRLELAARLAPQSLPHAATGPALRLALTAVVEDRDGRLSYWALRHAPGRPDFHHRDGFVLTLATGAATAAVHC